MALRRILGFDHIPNVSSSNASLFTKVLGGLPFRTQGGTGNNKNAVFGGPATPYLTAGVTSADTSLNWVLDITKLIVGTPKRSWFGVRYKNFQMGTAPMGYRALLLANYNWGSGDSTFHPTFTFGTLGAAAADVNGKEFYLEIEFDWINKSIRRWVDGVELPASPVTPASVADLFATRNVGIFLVAGAGPNNQGGFKDMYWIDDTEDGTLCRRLGPQHVVPLSLTGRSGSGWTGTSGASENTVLNTAVNTTTPDTPVLSSNGVLTPVVADLAMPAGTYGQINGIEVGLSGAKASGTSGVVDVSVGDGTNVSEVQTITPPTILTHSLKGVPFERSPSNALWTPTLIEDAFINLTPRA